ncbi:hypothetical protein F5B20DRAFT_585554 [Whalleya microplaca]|nr:hypothetical protein F5B20DRAFT_585554 [Whalleya microplaca]
MCVTTTHKDWCPMGSHWIENTGYNEIEHCEDYHPWAFCQNQTTIGPEKVDEYDCNACIEEHKDELPNGVDSEHEEEEQEQEQEQEQDPESEVSEEDNWPTKNMCTAYTLQDWCLLGQHWISGTARTEVYPDSCGLWYYHGYCQLRRWGGRRVDIQYNCKSCVRQQEENDRRAEQNRQQSNSQQQSFWAELMEEEKFTVTLILHAKCTSGEIMKVYARDLIVDRNRPNNHIGNPVITDPEGLAWLICKLRKDQEINSWHGHQSRGDG